MKVWRGSIQKKEEKNRGKVAVMIVTLVNGKDDNLDSSVRLAMIR